MSYFNKRSFTMRQVIGLLTVVFLGITVIAYAAVNIPNTFAPNTTISASQVNANFTAVANQMPGVEYSSNESYISVTTDSVVLSVDVTAPTEGYIVASFTGTSKFDHTNGTTQNLRMNLSTTCPTTVGANPGGFRYSAIPSEAPTGGYYSTIGTNYVFQVAAGTTTVCLVAESTSGALNSVEIGYPVLQAIFVPNRF